jgi:hypothetical protein
MPEWEVKTALSRAARNFVARAFAGCADRRNAGESEPIAKQSLTMSG